jgi:hypothetical protein
MVLEVAEASLADEKETALDFGAKLVCMTRITASSNLPK